MADDGDLLTMTSMLLPTDIRRPGLNWIFVLYLAGQTVAWAAGRWERVPVLTPVPVTASSASEAGSPQRSHHRPRSPAVPQVTSACPLHLLDPDQPRGDGR